MLSFLTGCQDIQLHGCPNHTYWYRQPRVEVLSHLGLLQCRLYTRASCFLVPLAPY
jgi:hypothetical protein